MRPPAVLTSACHAATICWVNELELVGRDAELRTINDFLERGIDNPSALLLEGEPGIGKTTLWLAAVSAARRKHRLVLSSRPAEAERKLAYAGLGDLFEW